MDPAGPRSPSVAGLRDLRASVLTNGCDWLTKSRREAGLRRNVATLVAVAAEFPVARVSTGRTDTGRLVRSPGPAFHWLLALAGR